MATYLEEKHGLDLLHFAFYAKHKVAYDGPALLHNYAADPFTNYFYRDGTTVKLCVPDTYILRNFAICLDIDSIVWFGHNGDPVELVPVNQVMHLMHPAAPAS